MDLRDREKLRTYLEEWRWDVNKFAHDVFGVTPDPWQARIFARFPHEERMALVACANPGKTFVEAIIGWNFLLTREDSQCAATAISDPNLKANLWKEMSYWYQESPLLQKFFAFGQRRIYERTAPNTWFMDARPWSRDADEKQQGKTLAGLHARHVLFLLDEAGGIPSAVSRTAENALGGELDEAHIVLAGNPLELSGPLYDAAVTHRSRWFVVEITGDPDVADRAPRVSKKWAQEQIDSFGRDDPYVQVYVLGKFPTGATNALMSLDDFNAAFARWDESTVPLAALPKCLGIDVAREGMDKTVVFPRGGDRLYDLEMGGERTWWVGQKLNFSCGRIADIADQWAGGHDQGKKLPIYVDDIGVGGGLVDMLDDLKYNVIGVNVGSGAVGRIAHGNKMVDASTIFANLKAQIGNSLQERCRKQTLALHPNLREKTSIVSEGTTLRIGYRAGRKTLWGKDEFKRLHSRSPDHIDAGLIAFSDDVMTGVGGRVRVSVVEEDEGVFAEEY